MLRKIVLFSCRVHYIQARSGWGLVIVVARPYSQYSHRLLRLNAFGTDESCVSDRCLVGKQNHCQLFVDRKVLQVRQKCHNNTVNYNRISRTTTPNHTGTTAVLQLRTLNASFFAILLRSDVDSPTRSENVHLGFFICPGSTFVRGSVVRFRRWRARWSVSPYAILSRRKKEKVNRIAPGSGDAADGQRQRDRVAGRGVREDGYILYRGQQRKKKKNNK